MIVRWRRNPLADGCGTDAEPAAAAWPPTIADELFGRLADPPRWIVVGAGTGATIGRHIRRAGHLWQRSSATAARPYRATHLNPDWLRAKGLDPTPYEGHLDRLGTVLTPENW